MTRVTPGLYRAGVRDRRLTIGAFAGSRPPITPFQMASAAVVRLHREGADQAWQTLDASFVRSPYWGIAGTRQAGWAAAIRTAFQGYRAMAANDMRPVISTGLRRTLTFPPDELGVYVDVLLLDPDGYVPRLVLWDANAFTREIAVLYASPAWRAIEDEMGDGRVPFTEVWHLRSGAQESISASDAASELSQVAGIVHRLAGP